MCLLDMRRLRRRANRQATESARGVRAKVCHSALALIIRVFPLSFRAKPGISVFCTCERVGWERLPAGSSPADSELGSVRLRHCNPFVAVMWAADFKVFEIPRV